MPTDPVADATVAAPTVRRSWLVRLLLLAVVVLVVSVFARIYRAIDLEQVGAAFGQLAWWHAAVLLGVLLLRQLLNATPLYLFIPEVSLWRAVVNDLSASTAAAFAPAPSDMVLRIAKFRSWGIATATAVAGTTLNAMTLFIVRFGTPLLGFAILPFTREEVVGWRLLDVLSLLVCAVLVTGLVLVVRGEEQATTIGARLGALVARFRRSVDPAAWAEAFRGFQGAVASGFGSRFPRAVLATLGVVACDLILITLALRFLGVGAAQVPLGSIAVAFLFAYPLTLFPMQGAGIVDTAVLAAIVATGGEGVAEPAIAALLVWRAFALAGPFLMGLGALALWKRSTPAESVRTGGASG